ncbi:hypothetical protein [Spiroplasma endosymbiont of Crioceris asparagi]|uniref:hypothetical protein n=1 Tax=Spiroplasma endosymbiont of Crioceris asparagi TaxID=3066286 RepID=UPI0030CA88F7
MSTIIILGLVVVVAIFIIVTSITGRGAQKKEQEKRKKVVREEIKFWLNSNRNLKNVIVQYDTVYARKGAEYKYRDVFDVIVSIYEAKTNLFREKIALEIEGITTKQDKKTYTTKWIVNKQLDTEETEKRVAIAEKKIKLSKAERKALKIEEKARLKKLKIDEKNLNAQQREKSLELKKSNYIDKSVKSDGDKWVPRK